MFAAWAPLIANKLSVSEDVFLADLPLTTCHTTANVHQIAALPSRLGCWALIPCYALSNSVFNTHMQGSAAGVPRLTLRSRNTRALHLGLTS